MQENPSRQLTLTGLAPVGVTSSAKNKRSNEASRHCRRVGITAKALAGHHDVPPDRVSYWYRTNRELFDRKLAEAAVALRGAKR